MIPFFSSKVEAGGALTAVSTLIKATGVNLDVNELNLLSEREIFEKRIVFEGKEKWQGGSNESMDYFRDELVIPTLIKTDKALEARIPCHQTRLADFSPNTSLKILVVDDALSNRKLLGRLLKHHGHRCDEVENGEIARAMIRTIPSCSGIPKGIVQSTRVLRAPRRMCSRSLLHGTETREE